MKLLLFSHHCCVSACSNIRHFFSLLCVQKEEEPDVVLVKVEEVEPVTGTQSQTGLSIQEGEWTHPPFI